jgi:methionyl-tRNA formyltransferase
MKIILLGNILFTKEIFLNLLKNKIKVSGFITSRKNSYNSDYFNFIPLLKKKKINYFVTSNINDNNTYKWCKKISPDIIFCLGWSNLIKKAFLEIPKYGIIGFHPSSLPKNRGRHPIIWPIFIGLNQTASSFFKMDLGPDTGNIVDKKIIKISGFDNAETLYKKICSSAKKQCLKIIRDLQKKKKIISKKQSFKGNYWRKRSYNDGVIDWRMNKKAILNLIKALSYPYSYASFFYNKKFYKVLSATEIKLRNKYKNYEPGKIVKKMKNNKFIIKCYDGLLKINKTTPKFLVNKVNYL